MRVHVCGVCALYVCMCVHTPRIYLLSLNFKVCISHYSSLNVAIKYYTKANLSTSVHYKHKYMYMYMYMSHSHM